MKSHRNWLGVAFVASLILQMAAGSVFAKENDDDEYNFNWLDPEKKIYVLQNRKYTKQGKLFVSALFGSGFSNPYRSTLNVEPRVGYYLTENIGVEFFYTYTSNSTNNAQRALENASTTLPVIREIRSQMGVMLNWAPWYAKINVFNKVLYFDWFLSAGVGSMNTFVDTRTTVAAASNYQPQTLTGIFVGTGHQFYISQTFTARLDFSGSFYQAQVFGTSGESTWFSNFNLGLGIGLRL
jgi:outer membrane beta-barrel protein